MDLQYSTDVGYDHSLGNLCSQCPRFSGAGEKTGFYHVCGIHEICVAELSGQ